MLSLYNERYRQHLFIYSFVCSCQKLAVEIVDLPYASRYNNFFGKKNFVINFIYEDDIFLQQKKYFIEQSYVFQLKFEAKS